MTGRFTDEQGQHLAFIDNYTVMFGQPPAEADLQRFFGTSPPSIHQMLVTLAEKELIRRTPGKARSILLLIAPEEIPRLEPPKSAKARSRS
jgi:SOS-response transcriptional repressor LexA